MIKLLVGLGNPGKKFEHTRHNLGVRVVQAWVDSVVGKDSKILYMLPVEFMNNSGKALLKVMKKYSVEASQILLIHDDLETAFGEMRMKETGSAKGHNGVRSIHDALGTQDVSRLLVGVGRPPDGVEPHDYVLAKFSPDEEKEIAENIIPNAVQKITEIVEKE